METQEGKATAKSPISIQLGTVRHASSGDAPTSSDASTSDVASTSGAAYTSGVASTSAAAPTVGQEMIKLISKDNVPFDLPKEVAFVSNRLKRECQNLNTFNVDAHSKILDHAIKYFYYRKECDKNPHHHGEFEMEESMALDILPLACYLDC